MFLDEAHALPRKQCRDCKDFKHPDEFHTNRAQPDGKHYYCKVCQNKRGTKWRKANPEKAREAVRRNAHNSYIPRVYGISHDEYDKLLKKQKGRCPICEHRLKRPSIDHCHQTGEVRGVLCRHCNSSLSVFEKDPSAINRLAAYLGLTIRFGCCTHSN